MTREQKIERARGLKRLGWTAPQIGNALGVKPSTVRNWTTATDCADCGAPVSDPRSERCAACDHVLQTWWTPERIIEAIRDWAERYGEPPCAPDWNPAPSQVALNGRIRPERHRAGEQPYSATVQRRFGSFNAAIRAAGFEPVGQGHWREERHAA